jgi:FeS assembly SUF system protein
MESGSGRVPLDLEKPVSTHVDPPPAAPAVEGADLEEKVVAVLRTCYDPEIPVNIYELGLIYDIQVDEKSAVEVRMTLTSPACPVAGSLPPEVQAKIKNIPGVSDAKVEIVWEPPWTQDRMSDAAKLQLGLY